MSGGNEKKRKENMKAVCAVWTALCAACMTVMLLFASNKTIVIADVSQEQSGLAVTPAEPGQDIPDRELQVSKTYGVEGSFCVPLPKGVRAENVVIDNRYMDRELWLYIQGGETQFYEENVISGDISPVLSGQSEEQKDGILLKLQMNRVLEYKSTMEGNTLTIAWYEPDDLYEYIVVLDAAGGSETGNADYELAEKDLTLQVAKQVQKKFAVENVRLYLTRAEDTDISVHDRISLAEEVGADLYIRLCAAVGESPEAYGISGIYNEEYFIPGFGNADLADILTREVTIAASNRAVGLEKAGEESILRILWMPAAEVSLGYLSNPQEEYLLGQESYQEKLADGIVNAISRAVDALKTAEE